MADAAERLKPGKATKSLVRLAGEKEYPRLATALVRVQLDDHFAGVRKVASGGAQGIGRELTNRR